MAGFDTTSVAADVNTKGPNAIETFTGLAQMQNALNQNRLFQAKTLAGQYLEQSIGPDGQPDLGQFSAALRGDKRTASFAPEILQDVATLRGTGISNVQAGTNLAQSQMLNYQRDLATAGNSSKASDPQVRQLENQRAVASTLANGVANGRYSPEIASAKLGNGDAFQDAVRTAAISGAGGAGAQEALTGTPTPIQTGEGTQFENVNRFDNTSAPMGGQGAFVPQVIPTTVQTGGGTQFVNVHPSENKVTPTGFIANELSPQDLSTQVETIDADGNKSMHVLGDFIDQKTHTWKDGVAPPMTALGPLSNTAKAALGSAYGPQIARFEQVAGNAPTQKQVIDIMRKSGDDFDAGPHSKFWQNFGEIASQYHVKVPDVPVLKNGQIDQVQAREVFEKTVSMVLSQQAAALHLDDTNEARQMALASVPTSSTTPQGRRKILGLLEGNADALDAMGKAWLQQKAKGGEGTWGQFQIEFPNRVPPTIFQAQYMTPSEKADLMKGWSAQKKTHWQATYNKAKELGWLPNAE
jgi:hypothetical protein